MSTRGDQIHKLLALLHKHADLVAEAFDGEVHGGDKQRGHAIDALVENSALKPYEEGTFRLNPRLREFLGDFLSSYHAYQALRGIRGTLGQAREQWQELRRAKDEGNYRNVETLSVALEDSIANMAFDIERNLAFLHSLIATQYGNVDGLDAKLRQNRYYHLQVKNFLGEIDGITAFVDSVKNESVRCGLLDIRVLVSRRLGSKMLTWTTQIKDAQAAISKRLLEAQLVAARLKQLSGVSLWMDRRKTTSGWDVEFADNKPLPVALVRPERIHVRPQPDVADTDPVVFDGLTAALMRLPPPKAPPEPAPEAPPQRLIDDANEPPAPPPPHELALMAFAQEVLGSAQALSLFAWKQTRPELAEIDDGAWLIYCRNQLGGGAFEVEVLSEDAPYTCFFNETFFDILVRRREKREVPA